MKELNVIQTKLVAPKDKHNNFGKYDYRSLEDICEAVRPLLKETGCTLTFTDEIFFIEGRFYVKSTARITNAEGAYEEAVGYARESDTKSGCDPAQITGLSSSYSRKYAACSLLCVSGAKDYDDLDNTNEGKQETPAPKPKQKKNEAPAPAKEEKPARQKKALTMEAVDNIQDPTVASIVNWITAAESAEKKAARCEQIKENFIISDNVYAALMKRVEDANPF